MKVPRLVALGVVVSSWLSVAAVINVVIGCVSGVIITSLKKLLAYSSLSHSGWLLLSLPSGWWVYYLACYTGLLLALLRGLSVSGALFSRQRLLLTPGLAPVILRLSLLSLAGLPPFRGFLLK
jgi:NADH:ubiquinone oxidoreductase subunit 2 (subunit N)